MKRSALVLMCVGLTVLSGCGYTTGSLISDRYKTIHVEHFANKIDYMTQNDRNLYIPQLEIRSREAIVDRYLFDGNLRLSDKDEADLLLTGELLSYDRDDVRTTSSDEVKEYRVSVTVALKLVDQSDQSLVWEGSFVGDDTYYTTGVHARSESAALEDALTDLARRVVARTIEDW